MQNAVSKDFVALIRLLFGLLFVLNFHGYEIANIYLERDPNNRIMPKVRS